MFLFSLSRVVLVLVITTTCSDVASATKPPILNENGGIHGVGCQHKSTLARDYRGTANTTKSGIPCQRWSDTQPTWGQKAVYIRRNLPMVERVFKILKLIVISPHDSIKCQSWEGFEKIAFYHYKKAHFYTVGQNQLF